MMPELVVWLAPLLLLPVVALLGFAGCTPFGEGEPVATSEGPPLFGSQLQRGTFGEPGDLPVPNDYMASGYRAAIYTPSTGHWKIFTGDLFKYLDYNSPSDRVLQEFNFGAPTDLPVSFGGQLMPLVTMYRRTSHEFLQANSKGELQNSLLLGGVASASDHTVPVPGPYFTLGEVVAACFDPTDASWRFRGFANNNPWPLPGSSSLADNSIVFGNPTPPNNLKPVPGNYYGKGTWRPAVFNTSNGQWTVAEDLTTWRPLKVKLQMALNGTLFVGIAGTVMTYTAETDDVPISPAVYAGAVTDRLIAVFRRRSGDWFFWKADSGAPVGWKHLPELPPPPPAESVPVPGPWNGPGQPWILVVYTGSDWPKLNWVFL